VVSRRLLMVLVYAMPVLIIAFAVVMGGQSLAAAVEDTTGALVLRWIGAVCMMLLAVDVTLLMGVLGLEALNNSQDRSDEDESR